MEFSSSNIRNVALVGHRGVGKTALLEAMLYLSGAIPKMGTQGAWVGAMDGTAEERAHLATLETRVFSLKWGGRKVNLLDTPGEASLSGPTKLALAAADAAILVISAQDGVQSGTERLFRLVREAQLPCLVVLTRMDEAHARPDEVVEEIRARLDAHADLMEVPEGVGAEFHGVVSVESGKEWQAPETPKTRPERNVPTELREAWQKLRARLVDDAAASDDVLTEHYLEQGDLSQEELDEGLRKLIGAGQLLPLFLCSPVRPAGIAALLEAVVELLPPPLEANGGVSAFVVKTHLDPHAGRTSWLRIRGGPLTRDTELLHAGSGQTERIGQIHGVGGTATGAVAAAANGDIVAVPRLKHVRAGDTLLVGPGMGEPIALGFPPSVFSRAFLVENRNQAEKLSNALGLLAEEDPTLGLSHEGVVNGLVVSGLGALQLEITAERVRRLTGLAVTLGPPRIPYLETFTRRAENVEGKQKKQSGGHGQFGVVTIDVQPLARGAGFEFEDAVVGGAVPRQFIPSVEKGVRRALERGVLAGFPVVDVKVRLVDGKSHSVDSSDAAFQAAGRKALIAAAERAEPALLEPVMKVELNVPVNSVGDVIGSLTARNGKVLATGGTESWMTVSAHVPLAQMLDYEPRLTNMTHGRGSFTMHLDHYDFVPQASQKSIVTESRFALEED
jgi:elongation factor G